MESLKSLLNPAARSPQKTARARRSTEFLAMTFVIIIIVILLCADRTTALVTGSLLVGFGLACVAMGVGHEHEHEREGEGERGERERGERGENAHAHDRAKEGFFPLPGAPAPHAVGVPPIPGPAPSYPGAIEMDEYDTEAEYGHHDQMEGDSDNVPTGNPFNTNRVAYPPAAGPGYDDEANNAEIDGDELNTYHARSRNDATRVVAGTMNRRRDLDKYLREEVTEAEDREWWGRAEG